MNLFGLELKWGNPIRKKGAASIAYNYIQEGAVQTIEDGPKAYIRDGFRRNPNVYALVELIAMACAKAHFKLINKKNPKQIKEIFDHPLLDMLHHPNEHQSRAQFLENIYGLYLLCGECFIHAPQIPAGMNKGKVKFMEILPPQFIKINVDKNSGLPLFYEYQNGRQYEKVDVEDMLYMRKWNPNGGIRGVSPLSAARKLIAHDNDAVEANLRILRNGGPKGVMSIEGMPDITLDQLEAAQKKWDEKYANGNNYGKVAFMGPVKWQDLGYTAEDLGIFQGRVMSMRDICNVYNVSSQLLNDPENKTYNNMQDARKALITQCVLPNIHVLTDLLNRLIVPAFGDSLEIVTDNSHWEELRDDMGALVTMLNTANWLTLNEKRKAMNLDENDGDDWDCAYIPNNLLPLHEDGNDTVALSSIHGGNKPDVTNELAPGNPNELTGPADGSTANEEPDENA